MASPRLAAFLRLLVIACLTAAGSAGCALPVSRRGCFHSEERRVSAGDLRRVTTMVPFPRGLVMVDGELQVLCRGRVRGAGGVSAEVEDQAGSLYAVDPEVSEPVTHPEPGEAVRNNGRLIARPTDPPFRLWERSSMPPEADRRTDRPYCTLRYDSRSKNFFLCAFSGIDKPKGPGTVAFSKNATDALLRFDARTGRWHDVERHDHTTTGYPHHDPTQHTPPHGRLNGPDNCLIVGNWLYAVAKDNDTLARYDISQIAKDPDAGPPPSEQVLGRRVTIQGMGEREYFGHSALAKRGRWLYIGCRTSSVIFRIPLRRDGLPVEPIVGELVATFEPYDPGTGLSANITDMDFDSRGRMYVVSAEPARLYRFRPNPRRVFEGRFARPWADLAEITGNSSMKSENVLVDGRRVFVTTGDGYTYQRGAFGTVYRIDILD